MSYSRIFGRRCDGCGKADAVVERLRCGHDLCGFCPQDKCPKCGVRVEEKCGCGI